MVFIPKLSLARTRTRICISLVDILNSLIVKKIYMLRKNKL